MRRAGSAAADGVIRKVGHRCRDAADDVRLFRPAGGDADTLALEAVREVGPAGHFFGAAHTMQRYERAFYSPLVSNWDNYDTWMERGQITARERANVVWKMVAEYEQPPIDPAIDEALRDYMERRKREGGSPLN